MIFKKEKIFFTKFLYYDELFEKIETKINPKISLLLQLSIIFGKQSIIKYCKTIAELSKSNN